MSKVSPARSAGSFWPVSLAIHAGAVAILAAGIQDPVLPPPEAPPRPLEIRMARLSLPAETPAFQAPAAPVSAEPADDPAPSEAFARDPLPSPETPGPLPAPPRPAPRAPSLDRPAFTLARVPAPAPAAEPSPPSPDESSALPPSPASNPPPEYPRAARYRGLEGVVVVTVRVSPAGRVIEASVAASSGHRLLDDAAVEGLRRWTFSPGLRAGLPAEWTVEVPVRFRLSSATARS